MSKKSVDYEEPTLKTFLRLLKEHDKFEAQARRLGSVAHRASIKARKAQDAHKKTLARIAMLIGRRPDLFNEAKKVHKSSTTAKPNKKKLAAKFADTLSRRKPRRLGTGHGDPLFDRQPEK